MHNTLAKKCLKIIAKRWVHDAWRAWQIALSSALMLCISIGWSHLEATPLAGSVEGHLLVDGGRVRGGGRAGAELVNAELKSSWEVRPSVDYAINDHIFVGGELGIGWLGTTDEAEAGAPRRVTLTPHARLRMDFPLSCALVIEGVLGVGVTTWGESQGARASLGGDRHWGQSVRMSLGLRYLLNTKVSALVGVGYLWQEVYGEDTTLTLNAIPVSFGLRSAF